MPLVAGVRGPSTVAGRPPDGWQGRRERGVLEGRGRPRTQPGASGTRPTPRDFGYPPLDASPRLGQYTAQDLLHLVKVRLLADQRWRQLDDRIAAIVCPAIEAGLEQCLGQEAAQQ